MHKNSLIRSSILIELHLVKDGQTNRQTPGYNQYHTRIACSMDTTEYSSNERNHCTAKSQYL